MKGRGQVTIIKSKTRREKQSMIGEHESKFMKSDFGRKCWEHLKQRPPNRELMKLFVANGVPMIGFGFADNFLMITFGNVIDSTFSLYVSTMAAAGLASASFCALSMAKKAQNKFSNTW